jgi:hypothetical protein
MMMKKMMKRMRRDEATHGKGRKIRKKQAEAG